MDQIIRIKYREKERIAMESNRKKRILFLCTHNSSRSQMAEGLLRSLRGDLYEVFSAGTKPTNVHPAAIAVMAEIGVDIRDQYAKGVSSLSQGAFDEVVTVCDNALEACPFFPGLGQKRHQSFEDPAAVNGNDADVLAVFRRVREEIRDWILNTY